MSRSAGANGGGGGTGGGEPLYSVRLLGLDVFDPVESRVKSVAGADVPCWMLDTDYDGECFRACQVFFPRTREWDKIRRTLRADFDDEAAALAHLSGDESAPFVAGDERGNELLVVKSVSEAEEPPEKEQQ